MSKITKALIGGNWKCNGTVASIKEMCEVLNAAGDFSKNSEV
jgi:triosephosphate isomerase